MEDGEIGNFVAAAAVAGANFGRQLQNNRAIDSWADYAHKLEAELSEAKLALKIKDGEIKYKQAVVKMREDQVLNLIKNIESKDELIAEKIETISNLSKLGISSANLNSEYSGYLQGKIDTVERACRSTSGKLAFYEEIYKLLILEIQASNSPDKYESFNPEFRQIAMDRVWSKFMKTGQVEYSPDLDFSYIDEKRYQLLEKKI
jgi:hypothetical protein